MTDSPVATCGTKGGIASEYVVPWAKVFLSFLQSVPVEQTAVVARVLVPSNQPDLISVVGFA